MLVLALGGCGEGDDPEPERKGQAPEPKTQPESDCEAKGLLRDQTKTGTCKDGDGIPMTVANLATTLKMPEVSAKLITGPRRTKTLNDGTNSETASGEYVVFGLAVTNRTQKPQTTALLGYKLLDASGAEYTLDSNASLAVQDGLLEQNGKNLQPGLTQDGELAFDVPPAVAKQFAAKPGAGNIVITPFSGSDGTDNSAGFGYFRLNH